jgi:hypothetical protein
MYTGSIQAISMPYSTGWEWTCSCGDSKRYLLKDHGSQAKVEAEGQLDRHMTQHTNAHRGTGPARYEDGALIGHMDRVECTHTGRQGKVTDPTPQSYRVLVTFDGDKDAVSHPTDTLRRVTHVREDDQDAIERPPDRDATHDVRHRIPSSQGKPESDPSTSQIDTSPSIIGVCAPGKYRLTVHLTPWEAFPTERLVHLHQALRAIAHRDAALLHPMATEIEQVLVERNVPHNQTAHGKIF